MPTYDPKSVVMTFGGVEIKGFADGSFLDVNYGAPPTLVQSFHGTIVCTLMRGPHIRRPKSRRRTRRILRNYARRERNRMVLLINCRCVTVPFGY